jgi:hypothetical protein
MEDLEEYKFPDEKPDLMEDEFKVEVVDDTPPEDRGRQPLPKDMVEELEKDDLEEYSEKVKKRLSQMKKVWHDERREKERASREREEALAIVQRIHEENQSLKKRLSSGEKVFISEITKSATSEVSAAKDSLKRAYESGDSDLILAAQEALTDAKLKLRDVERYQPSLQETDNQVEHQPQQVQPQSRPDPKAEAWRQRNTWFGANGEMTALALGYHETLVRSGVDSSSDEYYQKIDQNMRRRFPEYFEEERPQTKEETPPRRATTVVAPATRSSAPRQVRITASQASIAKRLGITPEAYVREVLKLENSNG